jgi:hypothetical protein
VETVKGGRLVTQATDGAITLWQLEPTTDGVAFSKVRDLAGPVRSGDLVREPQVAVDRAGVLTVGWTEPGVQGGGLTLWQEDRPGSAYLERGNLVPGTRDSVARFVTSPRGSLAVALRRADENAIVRVKHLPAGKAKWTDGVRLVSPKPDPSTSAAWAIGTPNNAQGLRVVVNDTVGVYGFRFDAPRPYTKVTKPVRTSQKVRTYRIGWSTSWTFADDWHVRQRVDKGTRYGAWQQVDVPEAEQSTIVTRARGRTFCYQARGLLGEDHVTPWSKQRCVTVRR